MKLNNQECYEKLEEQLKKIARRNKIHVTEVKKILKINNPSPKEKFDYIFEKLPPIVGRVTLEPLDDDYIFYAKEFFTYHPIHGMINLNFEKIAESMVLSLRSNRNNTDFYLDFIVELKKIKRINKLKNLGIRYWSKSGDEVKDMLYIYHTDV